MGQVTINCGAGQSATAGNKRDAYDMRRNAGSFIPAPPIKKIKVEKKYEIGFYSDQICSQCCKLAEHDYDPKEHCSVCNGIFKKGRDLSIFKSKFLTKSERQVIQDSQTITLRVM